MKSVERFFNDNLKSKPLSFRDKFPFNIFIHKFLKSDFEDLHDHPWDFISIPISFRNFLQTEAAATLAAVSLALALSSTFLTSLWLNFNVPGKSA